MKQSLTHKTFEPLTVGVISPIAFAITSQIPWVDYLNLTYWKLFNLHIEQHFSFFLSKFTVRKPLTPFLRFTTAIRANWRFFSTSTHIAFNVVRGRKLSLCHSVKHYEAVDEYVFMI